MRGTVKLAVAADINPRGPNPGEISPDALCDFVPMSAVDEDGGMHISEKRPYREVSKGYTPFRSDDVLVAKITPCFENGKIALAKTSTAFAFGSTEFHVIRCRETKLNPKYLLHFLRQDRIRHEGEKRMTGSAGQKRVPKQFLEGLELPIHSMLEQSRIAAILDKADAIRRKREQALALADDYLRSVFLEMFGDLAKNDRQWPSMALRKHIRHSNNGLSRRRKVPENVGQIVLRIQDIKPNSIDFGQPNRISLDEKEMSRFELEVGDVLFVRVNGNPDYVGRCTVFHGYSEPVCHNDHIIRLKMDDAYNPEFLSFLFNMDMGRQLLSNAIKTSAGQYTISQDGINELRMPCPPRSLQLRFQEIVSAVNNQRQRLEVAHEESIQLFGALSQRAFHGEL